MFEYVTHFNNLCTFALMVLDQLLGHVMSWVVQIMCTCDAREICCSNDGHWLGFDVNISKILDMCSNSYGKCRQSTKFMCDIYDEEYMHLKT